MVYGLWFRVKGLGIGVYGLGSPLVGAVGKDSGGVLQARVQKHAVCSGGIHLYLGFRV